MSAHRQIREGFLAALGQGLTRFGFPSKVIGSTLFFQQKTPLGHIGVHVNPISSGQHVYFSISCAISAQRVQDVLVHTRLYDWDGGLTWTCGALLLNFHKYQAWNRPMSVFQADLAALGIANRPEKEMLNDIYIGVASDDAVIAEGARIVVAQVEQLAWPWLQKYGYSEEAFLEFCMRNDPFANIVFTRLQKHALSGLILARHLARPDAEPAIKAAAEKLGRRYARMGNAEPLEEYRSLAAELGFL